jgi:Protein of unknown function (DUF3618)
MADPGRAVDVHGGVVAGGGVEKRAAAATPEVAGRTDGNRRAVNGQVSSGKPEALVAQIERTREDLARTIDTLAERVSPGHNARVLRQRLTEQAKQPEVQLAAAAVLLGGVGLVILRVWGRRRHR